ncbi:MAG: NADH-quinone oxidoreductase subunit I [Planctomycetota bacterium]
MGESILTACPKSRGKGGECRHCRAACPVGVRPERASVKTCLRCGACTASCPLGAPARGARPRGRLRGGKVWESSCSRVGDPEKSLVWPCLGSIPEESVLLAAASGVTTFRFLHGACKKCRFEPAFRAFQHRKDWLIAQLKSLGIAEGDVQFREGDGILQNPDRRDLFKGIFGRWGTRSTTEGRGPGNPSPRRGRAVELKSDPKIRNSAWTPAGKLEASEACSLCGLCARICPTGALQLAGADGQVRLLFAGVKCMNCRSCIARCPEDALHPVRDFRLSETRKTEPRDLLARRGRLCGKCGSLTKGDTCPPCEGRQGIAERLMGAVGGGGGTPC